MSTISKHVVEGVESENKIISIVDKLLEKPFNRENPRDCWLEIQERMHEEGIVSIEQTSFAKNYFVEKQVEYA